MLIYRIPRRLAYVIITLLDLNFCESILNRETKKYTTKQIKDIAQLLHNLAIIEYEAYKHTGHEKECNHLHKGFN